ncbi:MAG: DUF1587 domain-containing protein, partial [bacterium]|nr:DUF1587 domain-containing protein [bacterium]
MTLSKSLSDRKVVALAMWAIWCAAPGTCPAQSSPDQSATAQTSPDQSNTDQSTSISSPQDDKLAKQKANAEKFFRNQVTPFIRTYCLECHQNKRPTEAGVNFSPALKSPGHAAFSQQWKKAAARVKAHDMPPEGMEQPTAKERRMFLRWLNKVKFLSPKDPGPFVIRRLTKSEYGNTLHDLFGVAPSIADGLPDDVAGAGYLNSLSPLQLEQYLAIADKVLDQVLEEDLSLPIEFEEQLLGESHNSQTDPRSMARMVAQSLAKKAYRRPTTEAEIDVLLDVFDLGIQSELSDLAAQRLMLKAILVSPQFLFITPASEFDT